ncbi:MAG: hypothetical protein QM800_04865 [Paludibacter sp.]
MIFTGLLTWEKHALEFAHAEDYVDDIKNECLSIEMIPLHFQADKSTYKRFGNYVHRYRRNKNTTWYIIYNRDEYKNIFIQRIMSNHFTQNAD